MGTKLSAKKIDEVVAFHGHWCPGLALGIRLAERALEEVGRAGDEEIVAVAESDSCAVDAVQALTGCTVGKGNLLVRNVGKMAVSFYRRRDGKAIRLVARPRPEEAGDVYRELQAKSNAGSLTEEERRHFALLRDGRAKAILDADSDVLFQMGPAECPLPPHAEMEASLICQGCGEKFMETKGRLRRGRVLCLDCFDAERGRA